MDFFFLLLTLFTNNLIPIFLSAGAGYIIGRAFNLDVKPASRLVFYIFSPCLVFTALVETKLSVTDFGRMALFALSTMLLFGVSAFILGKALKLDRPTLAALMVINLFGNGGNYGLSLTLFAFGEAALAWATVYYTVTALTVNTLGVIIASSGKVSFRESMLGLFKLPMLYGILAAALLRSLNLELPLAVMRSAKLLSGAALPVMLIILGLQLAQIKRIERPRLVAIASVFQLACGAIFGLALAPLLGLTGVARQAGIIEAAMPTAVVVTILGIEYDINPHFITGVVLLTTLLSPLTLTPLLAFLQ
jgi:predicted permease